MRVMSFAQVLLLLALLAYVLLVSLENPGLVRLPLPFGEREWLLPTGLTVALFVGLGGFYVFFLFFPVLLRNWKRGRQMVQERQKLERRLVETLGARLGSQGMSKPEGVAQTKEGAE